MSDDAENPSETGREKVLGYLGHVDSIAMCSPVALDLVGVNSGWPSHKPTYRKIRSWGGVSTILCSDGLTDPFPNRPANVGHGIELFIETPGELEDPISSWQFWLLRSACDLVARDGQFRNDLDYFGIKTVSFTGWPGPAEWADADHVVGAIMGLPTPHFLQHCYLKTGVIRLVPLTIVRPQELLVARKTIGDLWKLFGSLYSRGSACHFSSLDAPVRLME